MMTHDYSTCGGPEHCDYCRAILNESPEQACARLAKENRERVLRTASLRTSIHPQEDSRNDYTPPNPYEHGLATLRAAESTLTTPERQFEQRYQRMQTLALEQQTLDRDVEQEIRALAEYRRQLDASSPLAGYAAPDPYTAGLDKLRSEGR